MISKCYRDRKILDNATTKLPRAPIVPLYRMDLRPSKEWPDENRSDLSCVERSVEGPRPFGMCGGTVTLKRIRHYSEVALKVVHLQSAFFRLLQAENVKVTDAENQKVIKSIDWVAAV
jgi:hypothetical protein